MKILLFNPMYVGVVSLSLITLSYIFLDIPLALYCRELGGIITDTAQIITVMGDSKWYFVGLATLAFFFKFILKHSLWLRRVIFVLASLAASGLICTILKWLTGRHRPVQLFDPGLTGFGFFGFGYELTSFPSGHTVTVFALAAAVGILFPRYGIPAFIFATAVAATRVILTSHYLGDTIGGAALAIIVTWAVKSHFDRKELHIRR